MKRQRHALNFRFKLLIALAVILLAFCFSLGYIWKTLKGLEYFNIKDITVRGVNPEEVELFYFKGKNIFALDLKKESRYLRDAYPDYRSINLIKVLPNRIFADFIKRKAVALVKLYKNFAVDKDGILFYPSDAAGRTDVALPVIVGLETKVFGPKSGTRYDLGELSLALNLISAAKRNKALKDYPLIKVDVTDLANAEIFIGLPPKTVGYSGQKAITKSESLQVKIGQDDAASKIAILAGLVNQRNLDIENVKYIDLRFKEPVIKLKDAK